MHHEPTLTYKGLTIILSNPSRFDTAKLLSGNSGAWFAEECLRPETNRFQCDIWSVDSFNKADRKFKDGTKVCLLLGARAQKEIGGLTDRTLHEQRGSPYSLSNGMVAISSYLPQDTFDLQDYENKLNPLLNGSLDSSDGNSLGDDSDNSDDKEVNQASEKSRHGRTARSNWRFWLQRDTKKAVRIALEGGHLRLPPEPEYVIYPSAEDVINELTRYKNEDLFLDIETDSNLNITCFGFTFGRSNSIFVVPLITYHYVLAYDWNGRILRALSIAMAKNRTIAHNGSGFDFLVFPFKYRLPFGESLGDTLIMHHRCFPEVEKSLGHGISNFTDLAYHKDEGVFEPQSEQQQKQLWAYNGKDVFGMRELYYGILNYANSRPGLRASIDQANSSIYPYVLAMLQGMRYRTDIVTQTLAHNDRMMMHLLRMVEACIGKDMVMEMRAKGKSSLPSSSTQCVKYFHGVCGYKVMGYGKPSVKDGKRKPSLNEKNFHKLAIWLKEQNIYHPLIDIVLQYRQTAKESSMLKFNSWPGLTDVTSLQKFLYNAQQPHDTTQSIS